MLYPDDSREPSEVALWQRYKQGDGAAFAAIYQKYVRVLYPYGMRIMPNRDFVRDCIQDLFVELWLYRSTVADTDSVKFYLFRALRSKLARGARLENATVSVELSFPALDWEVSTPYETDLIAEQKVAEQRQRISRGMTLLTKRQQEAIYLRFYGGLSHEEIAELMQVSVQSSYNLISKAIKALKESFPLTLAGWLLTWWH